MDCRTFDSLTQSLSISGSRRRAFALLGVLVTTGATLLPSNEAGVSARKRLKRGANRAGAGSGGSGALSGGSPDKRQHQKHNSGGDRNRQNARE
jgi:hypothetical protein